MPIHEQTPRHPRRAAALRLLIVCTLLGAVLNITIAVFLHQNMHTWYAAGRTTAFSGPLGANPHPDPATSARWLVWTTRSPGRHQVFAEILLFGGGPEPLTAGEVLPRWSIIRDPFTNSSFDGFDYHVERAAGWPQVCLVSKASAKLAPGRPTRVFPRVFRTDQGNPLGPVDPLSIATLPRVIPTRVLPLAFLANTVLYSIALGGAMLLWRLNRRLRRGKAGRCRGCGYDMRGSAEQCPECGGR